MFREQAHSANSLLPRATWAQLSHLPPACAVHRSLCDCSRHACKLMLRCCSITAPILRLGSCARSQAAYSDSVRFDANADDLSELFDKHLQPAGKQQRSKLVTSRKDAIHLYRKIQRYTLLFDWPDEHGELWRDKLRRSARQEFEMSKAEVDPANIAKMLVTGDEAVQNIMEMFVQKRAKLEEEGKLPKRLGNPYAQYHDL